MEWLDVPTEPFEATPEAATEIVDAMALVVTPPPLLAVSQESIESLTQEVATENIVSQVNQTANSDSVEISMPMKEVADEPSNDAGSQFDSIAPQEVPKDVRREVALATGGETATDNEPIDIDGSSGTPVAQRRIDHQPVPEPYKLRVSQSRLASAQQFGGDESTEASVEGALGWLAANQESDGSWNASKHGAGRETQTLDRNRAGTGAKADTAMTGLAVLAFQGAGYTHIGGKYSQTVEAALDFLRASQMPSGDLAGLKQIGTSSDVYYARMYSHGMAALAIAEAYAMTGDPRLVAPIQSALAYTLQAQNKRTGGWRYQSNTQDDPGDTSQFGWQAMALLSSQNGGFTLPTDLMPRMHGYLTRVSVGRYGGLAVYRPTPGQQPTHAMTAEALAMRLMLKQSISQEALSEAKQYILQQLPGTAEENLYYWYYASLALFQLQDESWPIWNKAMKSQLLQSQVLTGNQAGSWNPNCIWAGYGGRVYSTAMACLCLEVYYRYLPIYRTPSFASSPQSDLKR